jgi:hypothetical protein
VVPNPSAYKRRRRWRQILGLFEQTWQVNQMAMQEAALKIPKFTF